MNKKTVLLILGVFANLKAASEVVYIEPGEMVNRVSLAQHKFMDLKSMRFDLPNDVEKKYFNSILNQFIMDNNNERGLLSVRCEVGKAFRFACETLDQPGLPETWTRFQVEPNSCFKTYENWFEIFGRGMKNRTFYIRLSGATEAHWALSVAGASPSALRFLRRMGSLLSGM